MSQRILRSIHVGVGRRGAWPIRSATPETGFQPVALCDIDAEALAAAREQTGLGEDACFDSLEAALEKVEADCCIICTPTALHVPLSIQAIDAGLAVLVEKGMAPNWSEACRLERHARDKGATVCVAQNIRYQAMVRTITRALREPEHPAHPGEVFMLCYTNHRVRPEPRTLNFPFASVWDMSCHHFDNMLCWFGPVAWMSGHSFAAPWSAYEHDNNTALHLRFANGVNVDYIHTHDAARLELTVGLHGQRGALIQQNGELTFNERPTEQFGKRPTEPVELEAELNVHGVLADFHRYVTDGVEPGISVHQNLEVMAMCEMAVRACSEQRIVQRDELALAADATRV